jgi:alkylation response protein AidB-like acyl-CoA dehydrogenase
MSQASNRYRVDLRDLRFVLLEQFQLGALLGRGKFEDWGEEEVLSVLAAAQRYATEVAGPLFAVGDRQGCQLLDGQVKAPPGFKGGYDQLCEGGFKALTAPPEFGGAGAPKCLALLVTELTSGANPALDMYAGLTQGAAELLLELGTEEQRNTYCAKMFAGTFAGTMCLTEPQAGSDVGESSTRATREASGSYLLRGTKIFISGGDHDLSENIVHLVLARVEGAPSGTKGLSLFIVPKYRADGSHNDVKVAAIEHKMGLNGSATCVLNFGDDGECRGELVGGVENEGMRQMFQMMNFARIAVGVQGLACASAAYLSALSYAKERKQGARVEESRDPNAPRVPILDHADVRSMLLEMKAKSEGIRALIVKAGWHHDSAQQSDDGAAKKYHLGQVELLTPLIKSYASDQSFRVTELAIQVLGGAGYTQDHVVEQYCRDAKVFSIYEGTNQIQALDLVGRKLRQDGGAHAQALLKDIAAFITDHKNDERLKSSVQCLERAHGAVGAAALQIGRWGASAEPRRVALFASTFLQMAAELCVAWVLLDAAALASRKLTEISPEHPDRDFYQGKVYAAEHFAHWVLPLAVARGETLRNAPLSAVEIPEAAFATI